VTSGDTAGGAFIKIASTLNSALIQNNFVNTAATSNAQMISVATGKLLTDADIGWNRLVNLMTANELFISNDGTTNTGVIHNNYVGHADVTGTHDAGWDAGGFRLFNNLSVSVDNLSGFPLPAVDVNLYGSDMPRLGDNQCYQIVKAVDVSPVLVALDRLQFVGLPGDVRDPNKPACSVALSTKFPPEINAWIAGLGLGGEVGRAIFRKLAPGQNIPRHVDAWMPGELDWRRFQIPIVTEPGVVMGWPQDDVYVHLEPGLIYEVRYDRVHEVIHGGSGPRIHLQVDQVGASI
jgi:hypothetical protein